MHYLVSPKSLQESFKSFNLSSMLSQIIFSIIDIRLRQKTQNTRQYYGGLSVICTLAIDRNGKSIK